ncbi:histidine phosphatase superfamily [Neohortaea acidophila]|uniref:3-phytase n=1 Tax=Neohortaea acidophila TaxID=245834 RepID=A0A6A6PMG7_9PEZI|nr:histidine phosphatase superfamily [Neohortaea acidophila]KAF2480844.1 histidine phosphatase superfamily [Neohortaea acidophila]
MTTLKPRAPYTPEELAKLYPAGLELRQVQILLRHGERTPVSTRFQNAGLAPFWPYCSAAKDMKSAILEADGSWDTLQWRRRIESLGKDDQPSLNTGSKGEVDSICQLGELTDRGRETTLALGQRTRKLYVDQLAFLPATFDVQSASNVYLRSTPIVRALESVQQAFNGLYPSSTRANGAPAPAVMTRAWQDETLVPSEGACKRFRELARGFADRAAKLYNDGPELQYINKKIGKYMPEDSPVVKVDSHPRLSGVMDSVHASLAHGKDTRLPSEFYDEKVRAGIDKICVEEWFGGYAESNEYRKLGIGGLVGDLVQRMVEHTMAAAKQQPSEEPFKISMAGCHDTTVAATLAAFGAFDPYNDKWPGFTSSIAFELFKQKDGEAGNNTPTGTIRPDSKRTWWSSFFPSSLAPTPSSPRAPLAEMPLTDRKNLDEYFVRLRYNDQPLTIPFCKPQGRHYKDDESFCTLAAFKEAADSFTPKNWKEECVMNLGQPTMSAVVDRPPGL